MEEIWKKSEFGTGNYEFSNLGRVRNIFYKIPKIVKGVPNSRGYLRIINTRTKKSIFIHREVAKLFIGNYSDLVVNHKDGNKLNNRVDNLEWVTRADNSLHSIVCLGKGNMVGHSDIISIIRDFKSGLRIFQIAKKYGRNRNTIHAILVKTKNLKGRDNPQPSHKYSYERFND